MLPWFEQAPLMPLQSPSAKLEAEFNRFWSVYPRPTGKKRAQTAFARAIKKTTIETILASIEWKSRSSQWRKVNAEGVHEFVPHPATFLNRGDYNDPMPRGLAPKPKPVPLTPAERERILERRARVDHDNHLEAMEKIRSGAIYREFPNLPPGSMKIRDCDCWTCRRSRGEL